MMMTDLGDGLSLADVVLGDDSETAGAGVATWAGSLARLHEGSAEVLDDYRHRLSRRAPFQAVHDKPRALSEAANELRILAPGLGVSVSDGIVARLSGACEAFAAQMNVLSPGDTCPDNNLLDGEGVTFFDFEFAEVRHLAWDVAYLRVPWPTCRCAWRLPSDVIEQALRRYRDGLRRTSPYVDSAGFDHDADLATLAWSVESAAMFLQGALPRAFTARTLS